MHGDACRQTCAVVEKEKMSLAILPGALFRVPSGSAQTFFYLRHHHDTLALAPATVSYCHTLAASLSMNPSTDIHHSCMAAGLACLDSNEDVLMQSKSILAQLAQS